MSEKIKQQILFEQNNFFWLREEQIRRRNKNISRTINEIIKNYKFLLGRMEELQQKEGITEKEIEQSKEDAQDYRKQIIKGNHPIPNLNEWFDKQKKAKVIK